METGTFRSFPAHSGRQLPGAFRTIPEFPGVPRSSPELSGVPRTFPEFSGLFRSSPDTPIRSIPEFSGINPESSGENPESSGILRRKPGSLRSSPEKTRNQSGLTPEPHQPRPQISLILAPAGLYGRSMQWHAVAFHQRPHSIRCTADTRRTHFASSSRCRSLPIEDMYYQTAFDTSDEMIIIKRSRIHSLRIENTNIILLL